MSERIAIVAAARTPFGAFGGALRDAPIPELAAAAAIETLGRGGLAPEQVDQFIMGVNLPGADRSIARQAALKAGLPADRVAITVDRACCSSLSALTLSRRALLAGDAGVILAGGAENMSLVPYFLQGMRFGVRLGHLSLTDQLVVSCPHTGVPRAVQAANEALAHDVGRAAQDEWALRSQLRYAAATERGVFEAETFETATDASGGTLRADESPRPNSTAAGLAALPTVYDSKTVTAGNAPPLSTGAAFLLLSTEERAQREGWPVLGYVLATAQVAGPPAQIASIPSVAARVVLERAGRALDDMQLIEINEAFAAVPLVTTKLLGNDDEAAIEKLRERTNVNGGAIACGHPTGATGARLVMTICHELHRRGGGLGLVTMCGGVGEGEAVVVQVEAKEMT